jgi:hypothetical protein
MRGLQDYSLDEIREESARVSRPTASTAPAAVVDLRPWEYSLAAQVGADRFAQNFGKSDAAHYDRGRMEDDRTAQHAAAAAEIAAARALDRYWTACGAWTADRHADYRGLADVGGNIEVRRIRDGESRRFAVRPGDRDRVVVACYVVPPEFRSVRVLGWVEGEKALEVGEKVDENYYRVPISVLTLRGVGV